MAMFQRHVHDTNYYQKNKEKILLKRREQYHSDASYQAKAKRKSRLAVLRKYGITEEEYLNILFEQKGACGICKKAFTRSPHIDHNRKTGKVRGLLCMRCNTAIGSLEEDPTRFRWAVEYLEGFRPHEEKFGSWYKWVNTKNNFREIRKKQTEPDE